MNRNNVFIVILATVLISGGFLLIDKIQNGNTDKEYIRALQQHNRTFPVTLPDKLEFAGELVPMNLFYVREGLDKELLVNTYWQSNTILLLKKANRYFPVIEPILKKYKVPDDFKYVALIESGLSNVVSPAGASGFWQFMNETGKRYGLEITEEVDERYHLEKATEAACKLLLHSYGIFSNWTLSAAAYNAGEGRITKETGKQFINNYYDLYLNTETSRYIYRILALKLIYEHPTEFGYYLRYKDLYPQIPTTTVLLDTSVRNLPVFAMKLGINYKLLKEFNPWLRKDILTVKAGKNYLLTIPAKGFENLNYNPGNAGQVFNDTTTAGKLFR